MAVPSPSAVAVAARPCALWSRVGAASAAAPRRTQSRCFGTPAKRVGSAGPTVVAPSRIASALFAGGGPSQGGGLSGASLEQRRHKSIKVRRLKRHGKDSPHVIYQVQPEQNPGKPDLLVRLRTNIPKRGKEGSIVWARPDTARLWINHRLADYVPPRMFPSNWEHYVETYRDEIIEYAPPHLAERAFDELEKLKAKTNEEESMIVSHRTT